MKVPSLHFLSALAMLPMALCFAPCHVQAQAEIDGSDLRDEITIRRPLRQITERADQIAPEALPDEARQMLARMEKNRTEENRDLLIRQTIQRFLRMQDQYTRANRLDEAVALRDTIQELQAQLSGALPNPGNLTAYRGQIDRSYLFLVTGRTSGSIWGTSVYTDDSDLSTAAVHSGLLQDGQTGIIKVTILAGLEHYNGTDRNQVASSDYENWQGSYVLEPGDPIIARPAGNALPEEAKKLLADLPAQADAAPGQPVEDNTGAIRKAVESLQKMQEIYACAGKLEEAVAVRDQAEKRIVALVGALPEPGSLTTFRDKVGQSFLFEVTGRRSGSLWGSDIYTDDSFLGTATVHAGALHPGQKGIVRVTILPGCSQYDASTRNGVTSNTYHEWQGSFRVEAVRLPLP